MNIGPEKDDFNRFAVSAEKPKRGSNRVADDEYDANGAIPAKREPTTDE